MYLLLHLLSFLSRTVDNDLNPHEDFLSLVELSSATSDAIVKALKDVLLRFDLPLQDCRGQCYDGASVMSGSKSGVATTINKVSSFPIIKYGILS